MTKKKGRGDCDAGPSKVVDVTCEKFNTASTAQSQPEIAPDDALAVNDGREQLGLIRPNGRRFEAYITSNDSLVLLAKCNSRDEALRLIWQAGEHRDLRTATKVKRMGLQRGWPDFLLVSPDGGRLHALELKRFGEDLSDEQEAFAEWCAENGVPHAVARTVDEALGALSAWECLKIGVAGQLRAHQKGATA